MNAVTGFLIIALAATASNLAAEEEQDSRHIVHTSQNSLQSVHSDCGVCLTETCVKAANQILTSMDKTVDPCDNFYQFACGEYLKRTVMSKDLPVKNVFTDALEDLNQKLLGLLEKETEASDPPYTEMLKDMFNSCMDLETIERNGAEPLKRMLNRLGGWPVVEGQGWDESGFDWVDALITMQRLGYSKDIIFELSVIPDLKNNKIHIIALDQAKLGMPARSYLLSGLSDPHTAAYFKLMVDAAKLLGVDETTAKTELLEALNFEMTLANYSMGEEDRRDMNKLYNIYTIGELQNLSPQVPWLKYFNNLINNEVDENERLIVANPNFIVRVSELIPATEKRIIANYMMWRVVLPSIGSLSRKWRDIENEYSQVFTGSKAEPEQSKVCLATVTSSLGIAFSSYYVRNYFQEESKEAALVLVKYVRDEFLKILSTVDWMDEETRREAIEKANAIKPNVGYPAELMDDETVMKYYENLTITSGSFFDNILSVSKWSTFLAQSELRKPVIKGKWISHANVIQINAFYNPVENCIDFPAAILQNALFNKDRPFYMNFGGIGYFIGHEITHGFDDQGKQFDKDGNNINWWGKDTDELFTEKAQCIINQYGNYTIENGMKLNGVNTQGENIADNGGLKEAYLAYQSWVEDNGLEQMLPGLDYNPNQLFWLSAANAWCSKYRPEYLNLLIVSDNHSPSEFRVIGTMSNYEEFSRDFNCPLGSPMNELHKCKVW